MPPVVTSEASNALQVASELHVVPPEAQVVVDGYTQTDVIVMPPLDAGVLFKVLSNPALFFMVV